MSKFKNYLLDYLIILCLLWMVLYTWAGLYTMDEIQEIFCRFRQIFPVIFVILVILIVMTAPALLVEITIMEGDIASGAAVVFFLVALWGIVRIKSHLLGLSLLFVLHVAAGCFYSLMIWNRYMG